MSGNGLDLAIYPIWVTPFLSTPAGRLLLVVGLILATLLLGAACWYLVRLVKSKPERRALKAIALVQQQVRAGSLTAAGAYDRVLPHIKELIAARVQYPVYALTEQELLRLASDVQQLASCKPQLVFLLDACQKARFARTEDYELLELALVKSAEAVKLMTTPV